MLQKSGVNSKKIRVSVKICAYAKEKRRNINNRDKRKFIKIVNIVQYNHSKDNLELELYEV